MTPENIFQIVFHGPVMFWLGVLPILLGAWLARKLIFE